MMDIWIKLLSLWALIEANIVQILFILLVFKHIKIPESWKPKNWQWVKKLKVKFGPIEFEQENHTGKHDEKCPYDKAYTQTRNEIRMVNTEVDALKADIKQELQQINKAIHGIAGDLHSVTESHLKLKFYTANGPLYEKLLAGLEYLSLGGNGPVKKAVIDMAAKNLDIYETICAAIPKYRLPELEGAEKRAS